jgi:chromosome segregation ATPase
MTDRDVLTQKASDIDDILRDKMDLERQLAEAAAAVTVQEEAISGYKTKLTEAGSRTASLQQVVDDKTSEAESLRGQLAQAGETAREFDKQRAEQDGALARRDKALAGLRDEFAQAKALQEEHAAGQVEMGNRVKDLEAQLSTSGEQRNAAKDELGKAAETHRAITEELRQAQEALTRCGEEKGKIQQALDEARRAIEGQTAQLSAEAELRSAMELDLEVSRCALNELKVALVEADREFSHDISSNG